jgi:hypothetical protein
VVCGIVGAAFLAAAVFEIKAGGLLAVLLPAFVPIYLQMRTVALMNPLGAAIGGPLFPWPAITRILIVDHGDTIELVAAISPDGVLFHGELAQFAERFFHSEPAGAAVIPHAVDNDDLRLRHGIACGGWLVAVPPQRL